MELQRAESREQRIIPRTLRPWERSIYIQRALGKECGILDGMPAGGIPNLKDYSIIEAKLPILYPPIEQGSTLTLRWDGKFVRCGDLTRDMDQLREEFNKGVWALHEPSRPSEKENFQNFQWSPNDMVQSLETYRSSLSRINLLKRSAITNKLEKLPSIDNPDVPSAVKCFLCHFAFCDLLGGENYVKAIESLTSREDISAVALLIYAHRLEKVLIPPIIQSYPGLFKAFVL